MIFGSSRRKKSGNHKNFKQLKGLQESLEMTITTNKFIKNSPLRMRYN